MLTAYDGQTITYDTIGNPLSDGTRTYTWKHGRQLASLTQNGVIWNYTYNADGLRTSKSNGTVTYNYTYTGDKLTYLTDGTNELYISYDASGLPLSVDYNGTTYFYVTNVQGDVIGILNASGTLVVSYTYDAWGNVLSAEGSLKDTLGTHNPLRYRGYVYDEGTGLYYLQSRYYNPEVGRFINADDPAFLGADGTLTSYSLFTYCGNNPVMGYDPAGTLNWGNILKAAAVVVAVTAVVALTVATAGAAAVAVGAISASVVTAATTGAIIGGIAAGASEIAVQCMTRSSDNLDYTAIGIETFVGSANGAIDGTASTLASATGRLACKGGKVAVGAIGSVSHSVNQGKGVQETLTAVGGSICASTALQSFLGARDYFTGKLNTTILQQYLLDGAMTYGWKGMLTTIGIRIGSNIFRNRNEIIETVF